MASFRGHPKKTKFSPKKSSKVHKAKTHIYGTLNINPTKRRKEEKKI
jgi:hypothetical protein